MTALSAASPINIINPQVSGLAQQLPSVSQAPPPPPPALAGTMGGGGLAAPAGDGLQSALAGLQQALTQLTATMQSLSGAKRLQPPIAGGGAPGKPATDNSSCPMMNGSSQSTTKPDAASPKQSAPGKKAPAKEPMTKQESDLARFMALSPEKQKRAVEYFKKLDAAKATSDAAPSPKPSQPSSNAPAKGDPAPPPPPAPAKGGGDDAAPKAPVKTAPASEAPGKPQPKSTGWAWKNTYGGGVNVSYDGKAVGHFYTNDRKGNHEYNGGRRDDSSDDARISQLMDVKTSGGGHSIKTPDGQTIIHYDKNGNRPGTAAAKPAPVAAKPAPAAEKPAEMTAAKGWTTKATHGGGVSVYYAGKQVGHFYTSDSRGNHSYGNGRKDDSSNNAMINQLQDVQTRGGGHSIKTPDGRTIIHYDKNGKKA